jgi:IgA Peptidase M64
VGTSDGTVVGATKVVDHGDDAGRYVIAVLGDGFRSTQQADFETAFSNFSNALQATKPFDNSWELINVYRVDVHSTDSGADNPDCAGVAPTGGATTARTYFDATFCGDGQIRRLLTVNTGTVTTTANAQVPAWDVAVVIVNHTEYGGSGASKVGVYSLAAGALEVALHELGHSAFDLADEYEYYQGCGSGETDRNNHPGPEPDKPNVTIEKDRTKLKWRHLVDSATAIPTTTNADCTVCDPQANPVSADTIGLFEGAHYYHCKAYRPVFNCLMRTVGSSLPFCGVCQEAIKAKIIAGAGAPASSGKCFVAEAVYSETFHPDVVWLRRWRDRHLAPGARGRRAMQVLSYVYGRVGPSLATAVAAHPRLARLLRASVFEPAINAMRRRIGYLPAGGGEAR